jgi:UDP-glucose 4-epimerase
LASGNPITIWGDGEVVRDYVYIGDAVDALVKSASYVATPNGPRIFNVGAGRGYSLNQLIEAMRKTLNVEIDVKYTGGRPEDVPSNVLDISAAKNALGWKPVVDLETGLARTWTWLQSLQPV